MDKLNTYSSAIKDALSDFAAVANRTPDPAAETLCAFDDARGHYLLLNAGWSGGHRLRGNTVFVRVRDGKVHIEEDWTEDGIADDLLRRGIPEDDLVLAFQAAPPKMRRSGSAVA
ncbi:MAG TPA: XisI protein [Humisphaera sp.]